MGDVSETGPIKFGYRLPFLPSFRCLLRQYRFNTQVELIPSCSSRTRPYTQRFIPFSPTLDSNKGLAISTEERHVPANASSSIHHQIDPSQSIMPPVKWNVLLRNPLTFLKVVTLASLRSTVLLLARIILPFRIRKLTLRNALARAWIFTAHEANPEIFCSEPRGHGCQEVIFAAGEYNSPLGQKSTVGGWVIPDTSLAQLKNKDAIILFAHGGGYAIGHGLQNLSMFHRVIGKAKAQGQDIAYVTVKYRKSLDRCSSFQQKQSSTAISP